VVPVSAVRRVGKVHNLAAYNVTRVREAEHGYQRRIGLTDGQVRRNIFGLRASAKS
jgi:hypothetical protein